MAKAISALKLPAACAALRLPSTILPSTMQLFWFSHDTPAVVAALMQHIWTQYWHCRKRQSNKYIQLASFHLAGTHAL